MATIIIQPYREDMRSEYGRRGRTGLGGYGYGHGSGLFGGGLGQDDWVAPGDTPESLDAVAYAQVQRNIAFAKDAASAGHAAARDDFLSTAASTAAQIQNPTLRSRALYEIQTGSTSVTGSRGAGAYPSFTEIATDFGGNVALEARRRAGQFGDIARSIANVPAWAWVVGALVIGYVVLRR